MSVENGKCPSCGGALLLDSSKEKMVCKYCGHEVVIQQAVQKCTIDGIVDFDTKMLKAEQAMEFDEDFDKGLKYYKEALELRPNDFKALWGMFLCEIASINWADRLKGYVLVPGDISQNIENAINKYGNRAYNNAPDDIKPYYYREIQKVQNSLKEEPVQEKKQGCYIATCVYGSYDCPEVWTLRRYRDDRLAQTWFGRLFIRTYYAISPTLVKIFGKTRWFKKLWKTKLDGMIKKLEAKGIENTPYKDKKW